MEGSPHGSPAQGRPSREEPSPAEVTELLGRLRAGREAAVADLFEQVYGELRKRAEKRGGDTGPLSLEEVREKLGQEAAMTEEDAEALGVSTATVSRDWKQAKARLFQEMKRTRQGGAANGEGARGEKEPGEENGS